MSDLFKRIAFWLSVSAFLAAACTAFVVITSCRSFEPYWNDKLPAECNMAMNAMILYSRSQDKSGAVPSLDDCNACLRRLRCQAEVFGSDEKGNPNPVDYSDAARYRNYEQCRSESK